MRFDQWRAEAARIATGMYNIDLDRVSKEYLWSLYAGDVSPWEAAALCRNVIAAQPRHNAADLPRRVKRG
jgi:hypothetical protein